MPIFVFKIQLVYSKWALYVGLFCLSRVFEKGLLARVNLRHSVDYFVDFCSILRFVKSLDVLIQLLNIVWKPITPSNNGTFDQCQSEVSGNSDSENWDLAGTYYRIDAMHAGNQLHRSERFT